MPSVVAKEPCGVHVETPGCPVAGNQLTVKVLVTLVNPLEVLHQHVIHLVWVLLGIIAVWNPTGNELLAKAKYRFQ